MLNKADTRKTAKFSCSRNGRQILGSINPGNFRQKKKKKL